MKPLIGITGRRKQGRQIKDTPSVLLDLDGYWFYGDYSRAVAEAGGIPVMLSPDVSPDDYLSRLNGLLLSGGADISPDLYGAAPETDDFPPEPDRDQFELDLLVAAAARTVPVLGICRGLQMINVFAGGTLHQHVPAHSVFDQPPTTLSHTVTLANDSILARLYGSEIEVNSLHHQTVDSLGSEVVATGWSGETVEGLEHQTLPMVAVQWHPEMLGTRSTDPVFQWLVDLSHPGS